MWYVFAIPAAIIAAAWAYGMSKTSSKNIPISQLPPEQTGQKLPTLATANLIMPGDVIVVDAAAKPIPGLPNRSMIMQVDTLDVPSDTTKQWLMARVVDKVVLQGISTTGMSFPVLRSTVRKATPAEVAAGTGIAQPTATPAVVASQLAQLQQLYDQYGPTAVIPPDLQQAATMYNPAPGPTVPTTADKLAAGSGPMTIADMQAAAEQARTDAMNKLVPQSNTPEDLAALLALASLPSVADQS
jgi:hypothetical protein